MRKNYPGAPPGAPQVRKNYPGAHPGAPQVRKRFPGAQPGAPQVRKKIPGAQKMSRLCKNFPGEQKIPRSTKNAQGHKKFPGAPQGAQKKTQGHPKRTLDVQKIHILCYIIWLCECFSQKSFVNCFKLITIGIFFLDYFTV